MKELYIYNNPNLKIGFKIINSDSFIDYTSGIFLSLCTSYVTAETSSNLENYYNNGSNMGMATGVYEQICNKESGAFQCGNSSDKHEIIKNIPKINVDATNSPDLLHETCDKLPVLLAENKCGIVVAADYHEAANASFLNVPFIFKISKDELSRCNGSENFRLEFIKKHNNFVKEIKKDIKKHENI